MVVNTFILHSYGFRNWSAEQFIFNKNFVPPTNQELERQQEAERQRRLVEEAKNNLLARFPFYAANLMNQQTNPKPVPPPPDMPPTLDNCMDDIPVPPTPDNQRNLDPIADFTTDSYSNY